VNAELAQHLAQALADRLATIVPTGVTVTADEGHVAVTSEGGPIARVGVTEVLCQPGDEVDHLHSAVLAVLAGVQDYVIEFGGKPWPARLDGSNAASVVPMPGVRVSLGTIESWYGDEEHPAMTLTPITRPSLG
jgi:hypothetical protein